MGSERDSATVPSRSPGVGEVHAFRVTGEDAGKRLDLFLHEQLVDCSRSFLKELVKGGQVAVDGRHRKPSHRLSVGELVSATVRERPDPGTLEPQELPLRVLHEDASILVIDKQAGLVVHPGNGRRDGTLANALAFHFAELSDIGGRLRPGIVHRLDRDTSGVMVVARTNRAHFSLAAQFQDRTTEKEYLALVEGEVVYDADVIDRPLGRSRSDPSRIVVSPADGKPSETAYEVVERFRGFTFVRCRPRTGRTHQIRVHMRHAGHPILCDSTYGTRARLLASDLGIVEPGDPADEVLLERQALHAHRLRIRHPLEGREREFRAELHGDMLRTLEVLRAHCPWEAGGSE